METSTIRYLADDGAAAAAGLAADEFLMEEQSGPAAPPATLRLYTYRSHCALAGRFQDLEAEVNAGECGRLGVEMNRRPTGGGAILMGADQLGVAFAGRSAGLPSRAILARLADGILRGLASLGIAAELRGKNDLAVSGRKIAGLGVCRHDEADAFLFHASVLLDLDVDLMLKVLRIPIEKLGTAPIPFVEKRMTTVRREIGRPIGMNDFREAVRTGFASVLGARIEDGELGEAERREIERLAREKYESDAWIHERSAGPGSATGAGAVRAPGGVIRAEIALAGGVIRGAYLSGDFLEAGASFLPEIEARLRWAAATPESVRRAVDDAWRAAGGTGEPEGIGPEQLSLAVCRAIEAAAAGKGANGPYACFVGSLAAGATGRQETEE